MGKRGWFRWSLRVLLVGISTVAGLGVDEAALRLGWVPNGRHQAQALLRMWPGAAHRVVILGDSFLVPGGNLGRLLPEQLAEHDVAVSNLAISGTGPFEYRERLEGFDRKPAPDLVMLGYYAGNDLTDVQDNPKYDKDARGVAINTLRPGPPRPAAAEPGPRRPRDWKERWYLGQFFQKRLTRVDTPPPDFPWQRFVRLGMDPLLVQKAREGRINPWLLKLSQRNPHHLLDNILRDQPRNAKAWEKTEELISRIHEHCRRHGARLVVVIFPRSIQLDDSHFDFFERLRFELDPRTIGCTTPQDQMAAFCRDRGIPLLDLMPTFRAHAGEPLYLQMDDHLNRAGNRVAADAIVPFLLENLEAP